MKRPTEEAAPSRKVKIHEFANSEHRLASVALAYAEHRDRAVVVATDPEERRELTALIRSELVERGWLGRDSQSIHITVERDIGNRRLAANYLPGDQIEYKSGSPKEHGIAHGCTVTVVAVDRQANLLTVSTTDGTETNVNPALLRKATDESRVYRVEALGIAEGERIRFTANDRERHIRVGDFATVQAIGTDSTLFVRHDNGTHQPVRTDDALAIDHGYVDSRLPGRSLDRLLITGESEKINQQQYNHLSSQVRELEMFVSPGSKLEQIAPAQELHVPTNVEVMREGFGLGR